MKPRSVQERSEWAREGELLKELCKLLLYCYGDMNKYFATHSIFELEEFQIRYLIDYWRVLNTIRSVY